MQEFERAIRSTLSVARFECYRRASTDTSAEILARYASNMALGEAPYPILQTLEIALRNQINEAAAVAFGDPWWFDQAPPLSPRELALVTAAKSDLAKPGKPVDVGQVVAELNTWVLLLYFNMRYTGVS